MLAQERIRVNGKLCKLSKQQIRPGDVVEIGPRKIRSNLPAGLEILYEDQDILVVQKPSGMLTVATADERERTVFAYLRRYLKETDAGQKLFIVHRLDKFASGVLVFAKSGKVKDALQTLFSKHDIQRKYWAVVEGRVEKKQGTIRSCLAENQSLRMHSTDDVRRGKPAVTHYRVLRRLPGLTALEVTLETGRKNQIRVHLSEMGHPIAGDRSYGSTQNPLGRLGLHAFCLGFNHPSRGIRLLFRTTPPPEFERYLPAAVSKTGSRNKAAGIRRSAPTLSRQ